MTTQIELSDKEKLIIATAEQIDTVITKADHERLLAKYSPKGNPTGIPFSQSYKPIIEKHFFSKNKYFLLTMQCGESEFNGYLGTVTNWCQNVLEFKNEVDFYNYLTYLELFVSKKDNPRLSLEKVNIH